MAGDVLADVLAPGLHVVFCGTQAGKASAARQAYYAKPGNRFWPTLHQIGLTPSCFKPENYMALLPLGIGLTDLAKITAGQDAQIDPAHLDFTRFRETMKHYAPHIIAFTSKKAASLALQVHRTADLAYGRQSRLFEGIEVHVLPSTSGLATSHWTIAPWQNLAKRIREIDDHAPA